MISLGSWSVCVLGKRDAVPLAAAPIKCGVHRGDSEQDSGGDGCLLSSLTAIASFLIYKCKQTGRPIDNLDNPILILASSLFLWTISFLQGLKAALKETP